MNHHSHPTEVLFEYNQITDLIYLGTNACCQAGFDAELLKKEIKADISLQGDHVDHPYGVEYYLWLPTKGHQTPTQAQLILGVQALDFFVKNNIKVYLHCKNGHGRAPTLLAVYLVSGGMNVQEALDFIKQKRPSVHLNEIQIQAVKDFYASFNK